MFKYTSKCLTAALILGSSWMSHAETAVPTTLDFSEAPRLGGSWKVTMDRDGRDMDFYLDVSNLDGKFGATIDTERQPEPTAIETITMTPEGVDFEFDFSMGEQSFTMHLILKESGGGISGELREENGLFSGEVVGTHGSLAESEAKRKSPTEAKLRIDGKKVRITFGALETESNDYETLNTLKDEAVYTYAGSRATKLFTDADLKFGNTIIKTNNVAPDYPGVYSLWLKREGDKWSLVFNEQPDVWGTQHDAAFDVATVPLTAKTTDKPQDKFLVTLEQQDNGGQLKLAWGKTAWSTPFAMVQ